MGNLVTIYNDTIDDGFGDDDFDGDDDGFDDDDDGFDDDDDGFDDDDM